MINGYVFLRNQKELNHKDTNFHERAWMNSFRFQVCCRPYGAKTTGVSLYLPLTQWATVVTVFVMPR